nr:HAD family phosphatase [Clostridia bacterium]
MNKCLVFFDLDGTLLHKLEGNSKNRFSSENIEALEKLKAAGHEIFVNSGRSLSLLPKELLDTVKFDGLICGTTYIEYHGEVLHRKLVPDEDVRSICRFAYERGYGLGVECEKEVYGVNGGAFHPCIDMTDNLDEYMKAPSELLVTKFTFDRAIDEKDIAMFSGMRFINSTFYSEAIPKGFDKAFGMKLLGEKLGVKRENLVAFGDAENDKEMLMYAGVSVLMNKGPKEFDEFITLRTEKNETGVAEGVDKIFFRG